MNAKGQQLCMSSSAPSAAEMNKLTTRIGSTESNCKIRRSDCSPPGPQSVLQRRSVNGGKYVVTTLNFRIGKKTLPALLTSTSDYNFRIENVRKSFVIYDDLDRRAWLVNGASALLHLTWAQIARRDDRERVEESGFVFRKTEFEQTRSPFRSDAAYRALKTTKNQDMNVQKCRPSSKDEYTKFSHVVDEILERLRQAEDHRQKLISEPGRPVKAPWRKLLEGYNFHEIACSDTTTVYSVSIELRFNGRAWIDFTRAISAPVLFGQGFGELIQNVDRLSSAPVLCESRKEVPKNKDFLAATVQDLVMIKEELGPGKPTQGYAITRGFEW